MIRPGPEKHGVWPNLSLDNALLILGAAFSISITNNKAKDVSLLRLAMPPCLHVIRESTIKHKKDEP